MRAPGGSRSYDHPYSKVGGPSFMSPQGDMVSPQTYGSMVMSAPYGSASNWRRYVREIFANMLKENLAVLLVCFIWIRAAASAPSADPFARSVFIGLMAGFSIFVSLSWGYNSRLPRMLSPGAIIVSMLSGRLSFLLGLPMIIFGLCFAAVAGVIVAASGAAAIPIIGGPNNTSIGGAFCVQLFFTAIIAYTVLDQFTTRNGEPRTFPKGTAPPANTNYDADGNPQPFRAYHEDIGRRPAVYAGVVFLLVTFSNLSWGLFVFNGYAYFAGAISCVVFFGGNNNAFNNQCFTPAAGSGLLPVSSTITGAAALFMLVDVLAWLLAFLLDWLTYYAHNNEPERTADQSDDTNYGYDNQIDSEYASVDVVGKNNLSKAAARRRRKEAAAAAAASMPANVSKPLDVNLWTGN